MSCHIGEGKEMDTVCDERGSNEELEEEIKEQEIRRAIVRLARGKATKVCGIRGEVLKGVRLQCNGCM